MRSTGLAPMQSFAFDDTLSESVGKDLSCNVVRTWVHQHTVILGIHDSRLPFLNDGIRYLTDEQGFNAIVRNSGGLGVVLDRGVLNISLIFKGKTETTIDEAFTVMYLLVSKMFEDEDVEIETREITHSYCPGKFRSQYQWTEIRRYISTSRAWRYCRSSLFMCGRFR